MRAFVRGHTSGVNFLNSLPKDGIIEFFPQGSKRTKDSMSEPGFQRPNALFDKSNV